MVRRERWSGGLVECCVHRTGRVELSFRLFIQRKRAWRLTLELGDLATQPLQVLKHRLFVRSCLLRSKRLHLPMFSDDKVCPAPASPAQRLQGTPLQSPFHPVILGIEN